MTSRERVFALLNHEIPDHMGLFEHFWPETLGQYWMHQGYPKDTAPEDLFDYDIRFCAGWLNTEPFMNSYEVLEESEEWRITRDGRGASLKYWKNKSGTPEHIGFDCVTPEIWAKKFREPLLETNRERMGDPAQAKKQVEEVRKNGKFAMFGNLFVFELMRATIGDVNFLPALLLEPDWIRDFCQVYLDFYRNHYALLFSEAGTPDGIFLYEDWGYTNGLFCSPKALADLIMPYEKALVSFFKDYNLPVILHSCGDIRKAVPLIIEAGFDCLQPMEAKAGCDVVEFAKTYGSRLAYMGNINVVELGTGDKNRIKEEVVGKVKALNEMRIPYFFHSDHSIPPTVTYDSYRYALDLFHANKWYGK
jgi:uroporphyrinogen decarboxylase